MGAQHTPGKWVAFNPNSWSGGDCPVPADTIVEVNLANGRRLKGRASQFGWELDYDPNGAGWSICSYRVIAARAGAPA